MLRQLTTFRHTEDGNMTLDWMVTTAAMMLVGAGMLASLGSDQRAQSYDSPTIQAQTEEVGA